MKNLFVLFLFAVSLPGFAGEWECLYERWSPGTGPEIHPFNLMPSMSEAQDNFRMYGYSVKVEGESLIVEVREDKKTKSEVVEVKDPWGKKSPKMPKAQFTFDKTHIQVICR